MSSLKPFTIFTPKGPAPNPWKVVMIIEELGLPYEVVNIGDNFLQDVKGPDFLKFNPNGRVPAFVDPNQNNLVVWESGAIIEYLIETYDTAHKISASDLKTKWQERTLLHFQMSGQGPYFGQLMWFLKYHPEKVPSAIDRYFKEVDRVTMVLDGIVKQNGGTWLTGDKLSYADLSLVSWYRALRTWETDKPGMEKELIDKYPHWGKWWTEINERPGVKKVMNIMTEGDYSSFSTKTLQEAVAELGL